MLFSKFSFFFRPLNKREPEIVDIDSSSTDDERDVIVCTKPKNGGIKPKQSPLVRQGLSGT